MEIMENSDAKHAIGELKGRAIAEMKLNQFKDVENIPPNNIVYIEMQ